MSTLIKEEDEVRIECDMDYSKYVINGINYIPCTLRTNELVRVMDVLMSYVRSDEALNQLIINISGNDELRIAIPITVTASGKSPGEVINELIYLIIGIKHCLRARH